MCKQSSWKVLHVLVLTIEDELKEKQRQEQLIERRISDVKYTPTEPIHNVPKTEERCVEGRPTPVSPPPHTLSMPITVIPIPVVTTSLTGGALSPPAAPPPAAAPLPRSPQPRPDQPSSAFAAATSHKQPTPNQASIQPLPPLVAQSNNSKPQHAAPRYAGSIVSSSPPQQPTIVPQSGAVLQQAAQQNSPVRRGSPPEDSRHFDNKKRPGGYVYMRRLLLFLTGDAAQVVSRGDYFF